MAVKKVVKKRKSQEAQRKSLDIEEQSYENI